MDIIGIIGEVNSDRPLTNSNAQKTCVWEINPNSQCIPKIECLCQSKYDLLQMFFKKNSEISTRNCHLLRNTTFIENIMDTKTIIMNLKVTTNHKPIHNCNNT